MHPACILFFYYSAADMLYLIFFAEVIIEIIIKIIFKIFQIIRCEETVYCVCDSCNCCYRADNSQYPDHCIFLFLIFVFFQQITYF